MAQPLGQVPPLAITAVGLGFGLAAAGLAAAGWWAAAVAAWGINRLADGIDGEVARRQNRETELGAYLDLVADATVYGAVPLGVAAGVGGQTAWAAAAALLAACYVNIVTLTVLSALLEKRGSGAKATGESTKITMPTGLIEGAETIVLFSLLLVIPGWATQIMLVTAALVATTAAGRVWSTRHLLKTDADTADPELVS